MLRTPVVVVFLTKPVAKDPRNWAPDNPASVVPWTMYLEEDGAAPRDDKVWSPVLVPEDEPEKLEADKAPAMVRAPADVILLEVEKKLMSPVEPEARVRLPDPLAAIVKASLVPEEITDNATPPAAAADLILLPVAEETVEVSTWKP